MKIAPLFAKPHHPIVVAPNADSDRDSFLAYLQFSHLELESLMLAHGGILFRGFGKHDKADFLQCVESAGGSPFGYVGGNSPRTHLGSDIYTSTEYPSTETISLHNEMSYLKDQPRRLFFFCETPPAKGGQTSLANSFDVFDAMPSSIITKLREKGLIYIRNLQPNDFIGKGWRSTYQTQDRKAVEALVMEQGSEFEWLKGDVLRVTTRCDAFNTHRDIHGTAWFNQCEQWHPSALKQDVRQTMEEIFGKECMPHNCAFGDGEPIEEATFSQIRAAVDANKLLFNWEQGDLLMIDNTIMMHGREAYQGSRKILAYLSRI